MPKDFSDSCSNIISILTLFDNLRRTQRVGSMELVSTVFSISHLLSNTEKDFGLDCVVEVLEAFKDRTGRDLPLYAEMLDKLAAHGYPIIVQDMVL